MPKFGSTGATPQAAGGMTVPVRRPDNLGQPQAAAGGGFMDQLRGMLPEQGSQSQYDMIMQLVQAGMGSAQQSNSPLANLLAPMAGAMIGGGATKQYEAGRAASTDELTSALLGDVSGDPKMQGYLAVLNDPNAPAHLKSIAQAGLTRATTPASTTVKAPRQASNTDMLIAMIAQSAMDQNSPGGQTVTPAEQIQLDLVKSARSRTAGTTSGGLSVVDELTGLAGGNTTGNAAPTVDENDPLGILNIPGA